MRTKQFNLDEALSGAPVVNGYGDTVSQLTLFNVPNTAYCLVGVVGGSLHTYTKEGEFGEFGLLDDELSLYMKVETVNINGVECPPPETKPLKEGYNYYIADMGSSSLYRQYRWEGDEIDLRFLKEGLVFLKPEDAATTTKALMKPLKTIKQG